MQQQGGWQGKTTHFQLTVTAAHSENQLLLHISGKLQEAVNQIPAAFLSEHHFILAPASKVLGAPFPFLGESLEWEDTERDMHDMSADVLLV